MELLVVVLIVEILTAIALPQYRNVVEQSRATLVLPTIYAMRQALDEQILINGLRPEDIGFVGDGHDGKDHSLSATIHCTVGADNNCYDRYFRYGVWCKEEIGCFVGVLRVTEENPDEDYYSMLSRKVLTNWNDYPIGVWEGICMAHSDIGYTICKGLESQGWQLSDERMSACLMRTDGKKCAKKYAPDEL